MALSTTTFLPGLAGLTSLVGTAEFYAYLPQLIASPLDTDRWLLVRYPQYAEPEFLLNTAMDDSAVQLYRRGLYRLDPLLRLARSGVTSGVYSLQTLRHDDPNNTYFDEIFRSALIFDELSLFFTVPGQGALVVCIDRNAASFNEHEIAVMASLYPLLKNLHDLHLRQLFSNISSLSTKLPLYKNRITLILDKDMNLAFTNAPSDPLLPDIHMHVMEEINAGTQAGESAIDDELMVHWEPLNETFAAVPDATLCIVEKTAPSYTSWTFEAAMDAFSASNHLTKREQAVASLTLRGYPNSLIADKLGIAPGTVKNHKYHLYYKLNITTERELFQLFIRLITTEETH